MIKTTIRIIIIMIKTTIRIIIIMIQTTIRIIIIMMANNNKNNYNNDTKQQ